MNDERLQILRMVQEGKLSAEEAAKLLEALEQPAAKAGGARASNLRILVSDGGKTHTVVLSVGMVRWLLGLPGFKLDLGVAGQSLKSEALLKAIDQGAPGKVFEAEDGKHKVTIFVEA